MYKPISFNVIRQALEWSPLPELQHIQLLSTFKWPNGDTSGEYVVTFKGADVRDLFGQEPLYEGSWIDSEMRITLQECFCHDITVVRSWVVVGADLWKAELYGRVTTHSDEYQIPLFGGDDNAEL